MSELSKKIEEENDALFEDIYKRSYNSQFLPKEICRKCYDTALQMSHSSEQTRWYYDDMVDFAIDILSIKRS